MYILLSSSIFTCCFGVKQKMGKPRICAAILFLCLFFINSSSTSGEEGQQRQVYSNEKTESEPRPSSLDALKSLFSFYTSSPISTSYFGKLKYFVKQVHASFFPPNLDFRGGDQDVGGDGAGDKVKDAVSKSLEKSKAAVEDTAKSAAEIAGETVHKTKEKIKKTYSSGKGTEL